MEMLSESSKHILSSMQHILLCKESETSHNTWWQMNQIKIDKSPILYFVYNVELRMRVSDMQIGTHYFRIK